MKYIRSSTLRRVTEEEVERFLCAIAGDSFAEVLDRTMFEVAYSSAPASYRDTELEEGRRGSEKPPFGDPGE
jgi:site-specific recombinase XerD